MEQQKNKLILDDKFTLTDNNLVGYQDSDGKLITGTLKRAATTNQYTLETPSGALIFDNNGNCITQGKENIKLKDVSADIDIDPSKTQTRASDHSEVSINSLVPIDQFAIAIIGSMLVNTKDADTLSDAKILNLCDIAYKYAKGMIAISVNMRKANATGTSSSSSSSIKVDVADLQSASEKLLNNIAVSVDKLTTQIKTNDTNAAERYNNGIKVTQQGIVKIDNPSNDKLGVEVDASDISAFLESYIDNNVDAKINSNIDAKINTLIKDYGLTKPTT